MSEESSSKSHRRINPVLAWSVIAAVATVAALLLISSERDSRGGDGATNSEPEPLPEGLYLSDAPRISLEEAGGTRFDTRSLAGEPYLVTFLYTRCDDVCPLIGQDIRDTLKSADTDVSAVAVSVDPEGDTPARVKRWIADQDLPANFRYLVGDERELRPVWEEWFTVPADEDEIDPKTHASSVWVVDASGRLRSRLTGSQGLDSDALAAELERLRAS